MSEIVLTEEQTRVVRQAEQEVPVRDADGEVVGAIDPLDVAVLRRYRQRRNGEQPTVPWEKMREHMRALEAEWERTGGFDEAYAREFVARLRTQDKA
jgi:hypothetical protein